MGNLSERIKKIRKGQKLTQQELADTIGVSVITVKRWEKERIPRADELAKLAEVLNTTTDYLLRGEPLEPEPPVHETAQSQPVNNLPSEPENNLGLGYWGSVADNARKVAARGDKREMALITPLLRSALEAITDDEPQEETARQVIGVNGNIHGGKNNVNVNTGK